MIEIMQDGETIGEVSTNPVELSGDVPDIISGAVEAQKTTHTGGSEQIIEEWSEPTEGEIIRRLIAATSGTNLDIITDA